MCAPHKSSRPNCKSVIFVILYFLSYVDLLLFASYGFVASNKMDWQKKPPQEKRHERRASKVVRSSFINTRESSHFNWRVNASGECWIAMDHFRAISHARERTSWCSVCEMALVCIYEDLHVCWVKQGTSILRSTTWPLLFNLRNWSMAKLQSHNHNHRWVFQFLFLSTWPPLIHRTFAYAASFCALRCFTPFLVVRLE